MRKTPVFIAILIVSSFLLIIDVDNLIVESSAQTIDGAEQSGELIATSGSHRFVVWYDDTPGNFDVLFKRSTDNGATWGAVKNLIANPGDSIFPQMAVSGTNVYVVWKQESADGTLSDIFFRRSTDNGATWGTKINISMTGNPMNFIPKLAGLVASGTNVYVAWGTGSGGDPGDIFFRRSTDNGATWKPVVNLSNNPESNNVLGDMVVSGSNVYVVWDPLLDGEVMFRRSTDNGATWKPTINLSTNEPISISPQVATSGSHVYVVWLQARASPPNYDLFVRSSSDDGTTFGPRFKINSEKMRIIDSPSLVTSGNSMYVAWTQFAPNEPGEIFFRRTTDGGATWKSSVNLSNNSSPSAIPELVISGSNLYVAWNNGPGSTEILSRRSTDMGSTWKPTVNLSSNSGSSFDARFGA